MQKLKGKKLKQLNDQIYDRDGGCCVLCGGHVPEGTKFHHVIFKSHGGADTEENGVMLCMDCHIKAHGENARAIREQLKEVLWKLYQ